MLSGMSRSQAAGVQQAVVISAIYAIVRASVPASVAFVANIWVGWVGIKMTNIPMFLTIRRTTTFFTLIAEWYLLGKAASSTVTMGIMLTVVGALVAGWESLSADWLGYLFTIGNNIGTATSWSATKKFSDTHGIKGFGLTLYNALVGLPICVVMMVASGELQYLYRWQHWSEPAFMASLAAASALGVFMNYVVFLCTTMTSPLATSVTGNVKDIGATFLGAWLFGDFTPSFLKYLGIAISFFGSAVFSVAKLSEARLGGGAGGGSGVKTPASPKPTTAGASGGGGAVMDGSAGKDGYSKLSLTEDQLESGNASGSDPATSLSLAGGSGGDGQDHAPRVRAAAASQAPAYKNA